MADADFVIIGAGPAGVRAAETLVRAGLRPLVIDEGQRCGGQIYRQQPPGFTRSAAKLYGPDAAKAAALHRTFEALRPAIDYRPETLAWAWRDGELHLIGADGLSEARRPQALIIAAGATDRIFPLPGWTLPGVYSLGAAQIALKAQACAIGAQVVFMGSGPLLYLVAWQYLKAGAKPLAVLDTSSRRDRLAGLAGLLARPAMLGRGVKLVRDLRRAGVPTLTGITPDAIIGTEAVSAISFRDRRGQRRQLACDAVGFGYHLRAESQLADLAGVPFRFDAKLRQYLPHTDPMGRTMVKGVYLAGDGAQLAGADGAEAMGRLAAAAALADSGRSVDPGLIAADLRLNARMRRFRDGLARAFPWPGARLAAGLPDDTLVCRCEEITAGSLRETARAKGAAEVNRAKAFSRVGMGRCQGRFCGLAAAEILAAELAVPVESLGRLRGQAPVKPLPAMVRIKE